MGSTHRLDLTLSRSFAQDHGQCMVGVADVFNKNHDAVYNIGSLTSYETPSRYAFVRVQYRF